MLEDRPPESNNSQEVQDLISKLSMTKAFTVTQQLKSVDKMSREQTIELLKYTLVSLAYQQETYNSILKTGIM